MAAADWLRGAARAAGDAGRCSRERPPPHSAGPVGPPGHPEPAASDARPARASGRVRRHPGRPRVGRLRQPPAADPHRPRGAVAGRCRSRDRAHLRHPAHAGVLRPGHRDRRRPPGRQDRPAAARRAVPRRPPAPRHPRRPARGGERVRRLARTVGSRSGTGFVNGVLREIGRAHARRVAAGGRVAREERGRPPLCALLASGLGRPCVPPVARRRGARARSWRPCWRPTTPRRAST